MLNKIIYLLKNPNLLVFSLLGHFGHWIPDAPYLKMCYFLKMGRIPNLKNPTKWTEKIQWYKINYHDPLMTTCVDKYTVNEYVKEKIGEKYLIPLYGVWDNFDDVDLTGLPDQFVLKLTHNSGCMAICKDKETFDLAAVRSNFERYMTMNYYWGGREWAYKGCKPRIIAQRYEPSLGGDDAIEYKLTCYYGKVKLITFCTGRAPSVSDSPDLKVRITERKNNHFDRDWNELHFKAYCGPVDYKIERPEYLEEMIEISEKLAAPFPQTRVDLYVIDGKLYFGELTFYTWCGYIDFTPKSMDDEMGTWFQLPAPKNAN